MLKTTAVTIGLALLIGMAAASGVRAGQLDDKTVLTFSQPFEVPGHVLPAGTYVFKLADSQSDRHVVQVLNADGSQILAMFLAIPDYRLRPTADTVIRFNEVPVGSPETIRAWFYPGSTVGQEFVYPKARAEELAVITRTVVPAVAVETTSIDALRTAPLVAVTPDRLEAPVAAAIQTVPSSAVTGAAAAAAPTSVQARAETLQLPGTSGILPLILMFGFWSVVVGAGLMALQGKPGLASIR